MADIYYLAQAEAYNYERMGGLLYESPGYLTTIVVFNDRCFDFFTLSEVYPLEYSPTGAIQSTIYENTVYVRNIKRIKDVTDDDLRNAYQVIKHNLELDKLKSEKKLIQFPQRVLY